MLIQSVRPFAAILVVFAAVLTNLTGCMTGDSDETDDDLDANMEDDEDVTPEIFGYTAGTVGHEPNYCKPGWTYYQTEAASFSDSDGLNGDCHADCKDGFVPWDEWTCVSCTEAVWSGYWRCTDPQGTVQTSYYRGLPRPATCAPDEALQTRTIWSAVAPPQEIPLCYKRNL